MKLWLLLILIPWYSSAHMRTVCIIVHGTWGLNSSWYLPGGDFFEAFNASVEQHEDHYCIPFSWTGNNSHEARVVAGQQLAYLISSYPPKTHIIIIAHSHGANVSFLASQFLAKKNRTIDAIYALGAPINMEWYAPDTNGVEKVFNLFSFHDPVQPIFGMFDRQLPIDDHIVNIRVLIDGKQPLHSGLHSPIIATWLLHVQAIVHQTTDGSDMPLPLIINFTHNVSPLCEVDIKRKMVIDVLLPTP